MGKKQGKPWKAGGHMGVWKDYNRKKMRTWLVPFLFLLPDLIGVACFTLLPFLQVIRRSFLSAVSAQWVGFKNYQAVFSNTAFRLAAGDRKSVV